MFLTGFDRIFVFDKDGGGSSGDSGSSSDPAAPGGRLHPQRLVAEHGSAEAALQVLAYKLNDVEADNARYRKRVRELEGQVPEGGRVLNKEEAAQWDAFTQLGKPDEVKSKLGERDQFQGELETLRRDAQLRSVAEAAGYKFPVLQRLATQDGLTIELRESQQDGKAVQTPMVKRDDKETPLAEYATTHWGDFLPALQQEQAGGQGARQGVRFPAQNPGTNGQGPQTTKAVAESYIERAYKRGTSNG